MSYVILSHVATGDLATAALHNTLLDDIAIIKTYIADDGKWAGDIKSFYEDVNALGNSGTALTVDLALGNNVSFTHTGNIAGAPTFSNLPASGKYASIVWIIKFDGTVRTWAWLTGTVIWDGAVPPTFNGTVNHIMMVLTATTDGGATWRGIQLTSNYAS